jgi:hypothetical protein
MKYSGEFLTIASSFAGMLKNDLVLRCAYNVKEFNLEF